MLPAGLNQRVACIRPTSKLMDRTFLFQILNLGSFEADCIKSASGIARKNLSTVWLAKYELPLPSLAIQQEIVAEIEGYQKIIDGARQVVENYQPRIDVRSDWPTLLLGEICESIMTGPFGSALHESDYVDGGTPVVNPKNIVDSAIRREGAKAISASTLERLKEFSLRENDIVIGRRGEMGRCAVVLEEMAGWLCGTGCFVVRPKATCSPSFLHLCLSSSGTRALLEQQAVGVTMLNLNQGILASLPIPLPPLETQRAIVAEIAAEQALVDANKQLIARFEARIKSTIDRVWGCGKEA